MIKIFQTCIFTIVMIITSWTFSNAQNTGRWIITVNSPKAITYVDSIKFKDFDTRIYPVGKYKVKTWRPGGVLIDTTIKVRKDSISFLKLKIRDNDAFATYRVKKNLFKVKRWAPKLLAVLLAFPLQKSYMNAKKRADEYEERYKLAKQGYDKFYNTNGLIQYKAEAESNYNEYLKAVKTQNITNRLRLIVPALIVTSVVLDLTSKKPAAYVETPLLSYNYRAIGSTSLSINLICKF